MDHPRELLPLIAEGAVPASEVRLHLETCLSCAAALEALSPLELEYSWKGIVAELDAPKAGFVERILVRFGLDEALARFVSVTPSLRLEWLLASIGILGLAVIGMVSAPDEELSLVLLVAPVVAAVFVSFAYGPMSDPAFEIVAATPLSPLMAVLLRLAAVLSVNSVLVFLADAFAGGPGGHFAWFLPMTFVALFAAAVAVKTSPVAGASAGMALWTTAVFSSVSLSDDAGSVLWGQAAQVFYGAGSLLLLFALLVVIIRSGGFVIRSNLGRRT
jgi:hypothetical protein